jgi:sugar-specific transcriptional regulator TrmB/DNA-binding CsgD family transcriptional regulator
MLTTVLGATAAEDSVYRLLATVVSASEDEIVDATGLSRAEVQAALESLLERRLADRLDEIPTRFVAASPAIIESMIAERLADLRAAQQTLDGLSSKHRANSLARTAGGVFEIVRGQDALRRRSRRLIQSARSELLCLVKEPFIVFQPGEAVDPAASVRNRVVYETAVLSHPGFMEQLRGDRPSSDEARVHTKLPIKVLAVDQSVALVPLASHDATPVGLLIHESAVLDALLTLFEYVWSTAIPLHVHADGNGETPSDLSADDRELMSLLLAGLSDEAIAMNRGLSVRTVQRKVHALMELANVRTRMQLAWEAARREWV